MVNVVERDRIFTFASTTERSHPPYLLNASTPQSALKHLMEARSLKEFDLVSIFGFSDVTSGVINGKRSISRRQAEVLGDFFHVAPELFIG